MNHLIAIAYDDVATAEQVRQELVQATKERLMQLEDAVVIEHRSDGKVKLHQAMSTAGIGAAGGAMWGGLIGLLFLAPFLGMAIGAASGAAAGAVTDTGVDNSFMKEVGARLESGGAALVLLGRAEARDKVLERVAPYGGEVIQTSLSKDDEELLRAALGGAASVA